LPNEAGTGIWSGTGTGPAKAEGVGWQGRRGGSQRGANMWGWTATTWPPQQVKQ